MQLEWMGHSCFLFTAPDGTRLVTDPCDPETGYTIQLDSIDGVTVSHDHHDHNALTVIHGTPTVIRTLGEHQVGGVRITGYPSWHDSEQGVQRGPNILFLFQIDGVRILHLGDLGHMPEDAIIKAIGTVDVLLCPVGGIYTIDGSKAVAVMGRFMPRITIPMHYQTSSLRFSLGSLHSFLDAVTDRPIRHLESGRVELKKASMPEGEVWAFNRFSSASGC